MQRIEPGNETFDKQMINLLHHIVNVNFIDGQDLAAEMFKIVLKLEEYAEEIDLDRIRRNTERFLNGKEIDEVFDDAVRAAGCNLTKLMGIMECKAKFYELIEGFPDPYETVDMFD